MNIAHPLFQCRYLQASIEIRLIFKVPRMKPLKCIIFGLIVLFVLAACAEEQPTSHSILYTTLPENVKVLKNTPSRGEYTTLGSVYAEHFNLFGIKRQQATIHSILQNKAAELGGDAIIKTHSQDDNIVATVIRLNSTVA